MSARKVRVELTEPQLRALIIAAGYWETAHDPAEGVGDVEDVSADARRRVPVVARARHRLINALEGGWLGDPVAPLPLIPESHRSA